MTIRRVQRLLALTPAEAALLRTRARTRLGRRGYLLRVAAFALATAPLLRTAAPRELRIRAIRPLLYALLPSPSENALYVGAGPARPGAGAAR